MKLIATLALLAMTAPLALAQVTPFTFTHISDEHIAATASSASHDDNLKAAIAEMNAADPKPALVIDTGDCTEMGEEAQFKKYEDDIKAAIMPVYHSPGNHETRWADQSINRFEQHFGSTNISFLKNGVRFVGFNASIWLEHHGAVSGDTRRWIVEQLKQDPPGTPAVLFCHQPPMYPDNVFMTGDVELWEAIRPYNVVAFLNGHGHIFKSWTVNGVFCHMTKGMMNDQGGYTVYEVSPADIKVYEKLNGGEKNLVATLPLHPRKVNVEFTLEKRAGALLPVTVRTESEGPKVARVEYLVDHHQQPDDKYWTRIDAIGPGRYLFTLQMDTFAPGRHTLAVRAVDDAGSVWMKVVNLPEIPGPAKAKVFDAGTALQGACAADASSVYVGGWDGKLYAVSRKSMKKRWTFPTGGAIIGRPDTDDKAVYFGSTDESVYAVDKKTGRKLWAFKTDGPIQAHTLVADGAVFVSSGDHKLYAIDAKTGKQRWAYTMGLHAQARPAYADGTVYIGSWDGNFYAIDAKTGEPKWINQVTKSLFFAPAVSSPCYVDGKVITTRSVAPNEPKGEHIICFDATTGERLWGYRMPHGAAAYSSPTSDGKRVYFSTLEGELFAMNLADGALAWKSQMPEIAYDCSPVVHGDEVICNTLMGSVVAVNAETGDKLWSYKTGGGLTFAWPTVTDNAVYQPSFDGTLTAITLPKQ